MSGGERRISPPRNSSEPQSQHPQVIVHVERTHVHPRIEMREGTNSTLSSPERETEEDISEHHTLAEEKVPQWRLGYQGDPWYTTRGFVALAKFRIQSFRSRLTCDEASGSLGDLGTLIPLLAALSQQKTIRLGPAMFWMGVFNVISALQWDLPMPVQPMKSIAAVAINDGMTQGALTAAGILVGGAVWLLGATQLIDLVNRLMPRCVIAGMQVGLGVKMAATGCGYWHTHDWIEDIDGKLTCLLCLLATLFMLLRTTLPTALIIFIVGTIIAIGKMVSSGIPFTVGLLQIDLIVPSGQEWMQGLVEGALPQLPLSTLNSVVSVCALSCSLFGDPREGGKGATRISVASSVGLMNVVGCWFGGMPSCHGAGGLAGQYKFGARGGCSILMLGLFKMMLAISLGQTLDSIVASYPKVVLGVLLLFAGVELASVGAKSLMTTTPLHAASFEDDLLPCFVTAGAYIGTKNMALGVTAGLLAVGVQRINRESIMRLVNTREETRGSEM